MIKYAQHGGRGKQTTSFGLYRHERQSVPPNWIFDGCVLYYDFTSGVCFPNTNTTVNDLSTSANNGTLTNTPTWSAVNDGALTLNGTNQWINAGNPTSLNTLNFTISFWARPTNFANYRQLIFKGDNINGQYGLIINSAGAWSVQPDNVFLDNLTLNQWVYLVGTYDGTNVRMYRNGNLVRTAATTNSNRGTVVSIGADTVNNRWYSGNLGVAAIHNRALSNSEIIQNMQVHRARYGV